MNLTDACEEAFEQAKSDEAGGEHYRVTDDSGKQIGVIEILETDVVHVEPMADTDDSDLFDIGVVSLPDFKKLVREVLL